MKMASFVDNGETTSAGQSVDSENGSDTEKSMDEMVKGALSKARKIMEETAGKSAETRKIMKESVTTSADALGGVHGDLHGENPVINAESSDEGIDNMFSKSNNGLHSSFEMANIKAAAEEQTRIAHEGLESIRNKNLAENAKASGSTDNLSTFSDDDRLQPRHFTFNECYDAPDDNSSDQNSIKERFGGGVLNGSFSESESFDYENMDDHKDDEGSYSYLNQSVDELIAAGRLEHFDDDDDDDDDDHYDDIPTQVQSDPQAALSKAKQDAEELFFVAQEEERRLQGMLSERKTIDEQGQITLGFDKAEQESEKQTEIEYNDKGIEKSAPKYKEMKGINKAFLDLNKESNSEDEMTGPPDAFADVEELRANHDNEFTADGNHFPSSNKTDDVSTCNRDTLQSPEEVEKCGKKNHCMSIDSLKNVDFVTKSGDHYVNQNDLHSCKIGKKVFEEEKELDANVSDDLKGDNRVPAIPSPPDIDRLKIENDDLENNSNYFQKSDGINDVSCEDQNSVSSDDNFALRYKNYDDTKQSFDDDESKNDIVNNNYSSPVPEEKDTREYPSQSYDSKQNLEMEQTNENPWELNDDTPQIDFTSLHVDEVKQNEDVIPLNSEGSKSIEATMDTSIVKTESAAEKTETAPVPVGDPVEGQIINDDNDPEEHNENVKLTEEIDSDNDSEYTEETISEDEGFDNEHPPESEVPTGEVIIAHTMSSSTLGDGCENEKQTNYKSKNTDLSPWDPNAESPVRKSEKKRSVSENVVEDNGAKSELEAMRDEAESHEQVSASAEKKIIKKKIVFRQPYERPPPESPPRDPKVIIEEHSIPFKTYKTRWKQPSPHLAELLRAAKGNSVPRRSNACGALKVLASKPNNVHALARTVGLLEALTFAITQRPKEGDEASYDARLRGVTAILHLSSPVDNRELVFNQPNLPEALVNVIQQDNEVARVNASITLAYLAKSLENRERMVKVPNLVDSLAKVIRGGPDCMNDDCNSVHSANSSAERYRATANGEGNPENSGDGGNHRKQHDGAGSPRRRKGSKSKNKPKNAPKPKIKRNTTPEEKERLLSTARMTSSAVIMHLVKHCPNAAILGKHTYLVATCLTVGQEFDSPIHTKCIEILCHLSRFRANSVLLSSDEDLIQGLLAFGKSDAKEDRVWAMRIVQNLTTVPKSKVNLAVPPLLKVLCSSAMRCREREEHRAAVAALLNIATEQGTIVPLTNTKNVVATLVYLAHSNISDDTRALACETLATIGLWLQTLSASGDVPPGESNVLPTHSSTGWQRWEGA